jgi:hypothetical protein
LTTKIITRPTGTNRTGRDAPPLPNPLVLPDFASPQTYWQVGDLLSRELCLEDG